MANRNVAHAVRVALITAGAASAGLYGATSAAQEQLEEIVVTGSRIVRQDYQSASPIVTVSADLFKQQNATTVEQVLNTLPQFVPSVTNTSNNPSNGGQANVELRGLGTTRTLVLMDGKRIVPSNSTGVVDLNIIPAALLENVEVITGGASAVYGSDAVAGVVNFRMNTRFEGIESEVSYGQTAENDGKEYTISVAGGTSFGEGRGHAMLGVSYSDREEVFQGDRKFSQVALGYDEGSGEFQPLGSPTIPQGRYDAVSSNLPTQAAMDAIFGAGNVGAGANLGFNPDGTVFSEVGPFNFTGDQNDPLQPVASPYTYNFAPPNYLQLPLERKTAFGRASIMATDQAELYVQGLWANYTVAQQLASTPATSLIVPVTNPFITPDLAQILASRANPTAPFQMRKRMLESGGRVSDSTYTVYQITTGMKGDGIFNGNWNYDVYASFGQVDQEEKQLGNVSRSAFEELSFAADGGAALCGGSGMNPFGVESISPECAAYFTKSATNRTTVDQKIIEGTLSGPVYALPAGDLSVAVGAMYKQDDYKFLADESLRATSTSPLTGGTRADITGFNAQDNTIGGTDSTELYVEALVPILRDAPAAQSLDLTVGYRYADYSSAGGVSSYKSELSWQPIEVLRLRGSYQRAVRAPNISELFSPQNLNFPSIAGVGDPCSADNILRSGADGILGTADDPSNRAQVESICVAQGIPAGAPLNAFVYSASQVEGLSGGNPDLQEETADTYSVGVVFQSNSDGLFSDFQVSLDYFDIQISDAISSVAAGTFIERCYKPEFNPNYDPNNFYCGLFERDVTGSITRALEAQANLAAIETSGLDIQIDWRFDLGPGRLALNWVAAYTDSWKQQNLPGEAFEEFAGTAGDTVAAAFPEWKWTFGVGYQWQGLNTSLRWRFVDGMTDQNIEEFKLPSQDYFDLTASYAFEDGMAKGLTVRAGITNLTDEDPVIYPSYVQANTDPSQYDVLGRRYFLALNYKF
jgi:outer membrane receptor protein involved in Fe transport